MQVDWLIKSRTPKWLLLICLLALLVLTLVAYNGSDEAFMATDDSQEEVLAEHGKTLRRFSRGLTDVDLQPPSREVLASLGLARPPCHSRCLMGHACQPTDMPRGYCQCEEAA